jgi:Arylsulfatase A and related enzymes
MGKKSLCNVIGRGTFEMAKPNLLFIMYDQQRYDCVGMANAYPVKTPHIDALASRGAWFERAYTPIPVCAPARQALFTGRRPEESGGLWNPHIVFPLNARPEGFRWTNALRNAGYNTSLVGLWEMGGCAPSDYGFDSHISRSDLNREREEHCPGIKFTNGFFGESDPAPLEYNTTHIAARRAIGELRRLHEAGEPWYLHLDCPEPHLPCRPSAPFDTMYNPAEVPVWAGFGETFEDKPYIRRQQLYNWALEDRDWDKWSETVALYYGMVSQCDDAVGMILNELDRLGERENTIIVYTADHGDMCGSHRLIDKHYNMYDDLCRIPLAITWDGHIVPRRTGGFAHNCLDLGPTLLGLMGVDYPADAFHGTDLSQPLTEGRDAPGEFAVSTYNGQQFGLFCERMITDGSLKYVWNLTDVDELYDLEADPGELTNLINDDSYADKVAELRQKLYSELKRCSDGIIGWTGRQLTEGRKLRGHGEYKF